MKHLRKLVLALLLAALLLGLTPVFGADEPEGPDYSTADAVFSRLYRGLSGRKAAMDDEARAERAEQLLAHIEGVVPGSVRRSGTDLSWQVEGGVSCRFSPRLYALLTRGESAGDQDPEPPRKALSASGRDVSVFAPYCGMDVFEVPTF